MIPYFCRKLGKVSQNLSSAAVVISALRVNKNNIFYLEILSFQGLHRPSKLELADSDIGLRIIPCIIGKGVIIYNEDCYCGHMCEQSVVGYIHSM